MPEPLSTLLIRAEELSAKDPADTTADWRALQGDIEAALATLPRTRDAGTEDTIRELITLLERVIDQNF